VPRGARTGQHAGVIAAVVLLAWFAVLGVCAVRGWSADSRDPAWSVRMWRSVREFCAVQVELQERLILADRPWEQELLHWADGELHGRVAPPDDGRRRSVTADGWCACHVH
jgi:hypothetical protein